jgi:hypothetical protein
VLLNKKRRRETPVEIPTPRLACEDRHMMPPHIKALYLSQVTYPAPVPSHLP